MTVLASLPRAAAISVALVLATFSFSPAGAHCDSLDGPVVADARRAIAAGDVNPVLKWVRAEDETSIREALAMILAVRGESDRARALADRYFFETLVRVHRAGEGEGFTGLKPAGSVDPHIAAADRALADGDVDHLANEVGEAVQRGIRERFATARDRKQTAETSVEQGREYVNAYVQYTHFVEAAGQLASEGAAHTHSED